MKCQTSPNKRQFDNKRSAFLASKRLTNRYKDLVLHIYHCPDCGSWHLTKASQMQEPIVVLEPFRCAICGKIPDENWIYTRKNLYCYDCAIETLKEYLNQ